MVLWQAAQLLVLRICVGVFGVASYSEPLTWQVPQSRGVPLNTAFRWQASHGRSRCTPSSSTPVVKWSNGTVIGDVPAAAAHDGTSIRPAAASRTIHPNVRRGFTCAPIAS